MALTLGAKTGEFGFIMGNVLLPCVHVKGMSTQAFFRVDFFMARS